MIILQSTVYAIYNELSYDCVVDCRQGRFQAKFILSCDHATQGMEPMQAACDMM